MLQDVPSARTTVSNARHGAELLDALLVCGDKALHALKVCGRDPHSLQALAQLREDPAWFYDPTASPAVSSEDGSPRAPRADYPAEEMDEVAAADTSVAESQYLGSGVTRSIVLERRMLKSASARMAGGAEEES